VLVAVEHFAEAVRAGKSARLTSARRPSRAGGIRPSRRLGGSSLQEDMARVLVKQYAGDLDGAREVAQGALVRSRGSGAMYWLAGFLAALGFIETSGRDRHKALEVLCDLADIFASIQMVDLEQLLWAVDYADDALQVGSMEDVESAISVLRRQGLSDPRVAD